MLQTLSRCASVCVAIESISFIGYTIILRCHTGILRSLLAAAGQVVSGLHMMRQGEEKDGKEAMN